MLLVKLLILHLNRPAFILRYIMSFGIINITARCSSVATVSGARSNLNRCKIFSKAESPTEPNASRCTGAALFQTGEKNMGPASPSPLGRNYPGWTPGGSPILPGPDVARTEGCLHQLPWGTGRLCRRPLLHSRGARRIKAAEQIRRRTSQTTWSKYPILCTWSTGRFEAS